MRDSARQEEALASTESGFASFLTRPYAMLFGVFLTSMVAMSFDIPAVHDAALLVRWPVLGVMAAMGLLQVVFRGTLPGHTSVLWMSVMIALAAASSLWSSDPDYSIQRAGSLVLLLGATFLGVAAYARRADNAQAIFDVIFVIAMGVAVGGFLFRLGEMETGGRYVGLHNRATGAGSYAALFLPIALYQVRYRFRGLTKLIGWVTMAALAGQIVLSGARMALVTSAAVCLVLLFAFYGRRAILALVLIAIVGPIPILVDHRRQANIEERATKLMRLESVGTFTGRLDRWVFGLEKWQEKPWTGFGFGVSRTLAGLDQPWRFGLEPGEVFNLHSDQVEVLVDLGIVGYVPFAIFWLTLAGTGLSILSRPADASRQRSLAAMGAVAYAFADTFMHGGFLAAGGGVAAFSWTLIALATTIAQTREEPARSRESGREGHGHDKRGHGTREAKRGHGNGEGERGQSIRRALPSVRKVLAAVEKGRQANC